MKTLKNRTVDKFNVLWHNKTIKSVYEGRWVWYHTILAVELFVVILLLFLIFLKL